MNFKKHVLDNPFYASLLLGVFLWVLFFSILPVTIESNIQINAVLYILSSYASLILGFNLFNFHTTSNYKSKDYAILAMKVLFWVIFFSFILRWIDLFFIRELSFDFSPKENRNINYDNSSKSNFLFAVASVVKSLYFFPLVILILSKKKYDSFFIIIALMIFLFPAVEGLLIGTRKHFVQMFIIVFITLFISKKLVLNLKQILSLSLAVILVLSISMHLLIKRESTINSNKETFYTQILSSRYNDMVSPNDYVITFFKNPENPDILKYYSMSLLQIGQYIIHGLFEFNYLVSLDKPEISYGKHTFYPLIKFYNSFNLFEFEELENYTPRGYVYISFFGGIYLDFRWFGLVFSFLFGIFQKYICCKSKINVIFKPLMIYMLIVNLFLLSFNFLRGSGIYPIFGLAIFFMLFETVKYFKK